MKVLHVQSVKLALPLKADQVPRDIDPMDPRLEIEIGGMRISAKINAKAARKLKVHLGGVVLQGRLVVEDGRLVLADAGFQFLEPPASPAPAS